MSWTAGLPRHEIRRGDVRYPALLADTADSPDVLHVIGTPDALAAGLSVVGSRRATPYGLAATDLLAGWAASAGHTIISGGAVGCDQAAHRAALERHGRTVAVMAGGADVAYPRASDALLREIALAGAVVSEHPWGTEPRKWAFRTRNRIIAGLGAALLVAEAALPSGTFSTADYALDAGRTVLVVPGSIFSASSRGTNRLLAQGAVPITDPSELRLCLEPLLGRGLLDAQDAASDRPCSDDPLLEALIADPMRPDDVARAFSLDVVTTMRRIGALSAAGLVERYRDGRYGVSRRYNRL